MVLGVDNEMARSLLGQAEANQIFRRRKEKTMWGFNRRGKSGQAEGKAPAQATADPDSMAYLEESIAYSAFLASGVAGVEEVSFEEFVWRYHQAKKRSG
jgi:hypothetical protein